MNVFFFIIRRKQANRIFGVRAKFGPTGCHKRSYPSSAAGEGNVFGRHRLPPFHDRHDFRGTDCDQPRGVSLRGEYCVCVCWVNTHAAEGGGGENSWKNNIFPAAVTFSVLLHVIDEHHRINVTFHVSVLHRPIGTDRHSFVTCLYSQPHTHGPNTHISVRLRPFRTRPTRTAFLFFVFFFLITRLGHDHRRQIDSLRRRPSAFNLFQIARSTQVKAEQ